MHSLDPLALFDAAAAAERSRQELQQVLLEVIDVVDSLDRCCAAAGVDEEQPLALVRQQLLTVLARHGAEPLECLGRPFAPAWHEAAGTRPEAGLPPGIVVEQKTRGFLRHAQLLRAPRVIVSETAGTHEFRSEP